MERIGDEGALRAAVESALGENPAQVEDFVSGRNENVAGWFVGRVMRATGGRADPRIAARLVREALEARRGGAG